MKPRADAPTLPPALARELAAFIVATVRAEVRAARADDEPDPWVDHRRWPCASRRAACALARSGELEGVRRVGQGRGLLYLVRRSVLEAWIEAQNTTAEPPDAHARAMGLDRYESEMARRGLVPGAGPANDGARARTRGRR